MCFLFDCVCCEMMVLLLWAYFVVAVSIQMGLMLVLVTFDWLTVLCGAMCEGVVRHWLGTFPVGC